MSFLYISTHLCPNLKNKKSHYSLLHFIAIQIQTNSTPHIFHIVKFHTNVLRNELAYKLANANNLQPHQPPTSPYEILHTILYYHHRCNEYYEYSNLYKGPIRYLHTYFKKLTTFNYNNKSVGQIFPSIGK